jgi:GcrA cell cycle regulator
LPKPPPRDQTPSLKRIRKRYAAEFALPPVFEVVPMRLRCVEVDPRHLSLMELRAGDCRYPYGGEVEGEAVTFCGHPQREGASYCAPHFDLTRGPGSLAERTACTVLLRIVEAA